MPSPLRRVVALAALIGGQCLAADPPAPPATGIITGRVVWTGDLPSVPPLDSVMVGATALNPHAPRIDADSRGLAGAVVSLRTIDPTRGRAWDHPPVRVETSAECIQIIQGDGPPRSVGFVKRGDEVTMSSAAAGTRMLRARGAAFFTLAFPEPDRPLVRRFDRTGVVELSSGSGQFWAAADLFVCDHPYYVVTGPNGSFTLPGVPTGDYELVAWKRNWHIAGKDRDPETGLVVRLKYAAPVEKRLPIRVQPGRSSVVELSFAGADFRN